MTPAPATRLIDEGDRTFEVIHTPGHSPGSIMLGEASTGILFTGDTVYDGPLVDDAFHSDVGAYIASMKRILELTVRVVHGGHFPSFGAPSITHELASLWFCRSYRNECYGRFEDVAVKTDIEATASGRAWLAV